MIHSGNKEKTQKTKTAKFPNNNEVSENQINTFHVEHKQHINSELNSKFYYNMKKFEAITVNRKEYLFAPSLEQAGIMFIQLYGHSAIINEVEKIIHN